MTFPAGLLGVLAAATLAAGVHARWGRGCVTLGIYTLMAEVGFWSGHWLAIRQGWAWGRWGPLALGPGLLVAVAVTGLVAFLLYLPPEDEAARPGPPRPGSAGGP